MLNHGFVRVCAATPRVTVANPAANVAEMITMATDADTRGAQLVTFPELSLTGYTCGDLFQQRMLQQAALQALKHFVDATRAANRRAVYVLGLPLVVDDQLFNVAAVVKNGRILGIVPKSFLPNYQHFYESRWFAPAERLRSTHVQLFGQDVPIGTDLVFSVTDSVKGEEVFRLGVEICEDLWMPVPPSSHQALHGANILVNLSASNSQIGKPSFRRQLVANQSARCFGAYVYCAASVWESTSDLVFDGDSMIAINGHIVSEAERFARESQMLIVDVDVDTLRRERSIMGSFGQSVGEDDKEFRVVTTANGIIPDRKDNLSVPRNPQPFVPTDDTQRAEVCSDVFAHQTHGLWRRLQGLTRVVNRSVTIGISGGLDSTLALLATVKTFDLLGWNRKGIVAVTMPGPGTTERTLENAHALMDALGVTKREIPITEKVTQHLLSLGHEPCWQCLMCENAQARERTQTLMDLGFVIGTGDLSELALGWCTYNGDHMSMYNVNCCVPKTLVKYVVSWVADSNMLSEASTTLRDIVATPISPELKASASGKVEQKTEDIIGPYVLHDFFLYWTVRHGVSVGKLVFLVEHHFAEQFDRETILKWLRVFYTRFGNSQFKRDAVPNGPKVGSVDLSPRGSWRMPSDIAFTLWLQDLDTLEDSPSS